MNLAVVAIIITAYLISFVIYAVRRKPKKPMNIKCIGGNYLRGNCPKCNSIVCNCDGKKLCGISFCSRCGTKIKFPKSEPKLDNMKSVTIDEYMKGVRK